MNLSDKIFGTCSSLFLVIVIEISVLLFMIPGHVKCDCRARASLGPAVVTLPKPVVMPIKENNNKGLSNGCR